MIATRHIRAMLTEATRLAEVAEQSNDHVGLDRAVNLARHAACELEDELLRARDGWPVV